MKKGAMSNFNSDFFFSSSNNPMGIIGSNFTLLITNNTFKKLFGIENEISSIISFEHLFFTDDKKIILSYLNKITTDNTSVVFECRLIDYKKTLKWFSWEILIDPTTNNYYFSGFDITTHKNECSVQQEHSDKLLKIIELVPHPIFLKDSNAHYILVNQAQADLFSTSKEDFIGKEDSYFIKSEEELRGIHASDRVVLSKQKNITLPEQMITHPNGKYKILHTSKIPFLSNFNGEVNILGVSIDITEIKESENELRKINFELDSFVYHASHDLRAPLCSLEGLLNLIDTQNDDEFRKKCVVEGLKSIKRLDGFISDLTDLSKNNRMEIIPQAIKFKRIIKKTIANLHYIKNANNIAISVNVEKGAVFYSDKYRIKVIFMNLISNAINYQQRKSSNPSLFISIKTSKEYSEIEFRDNGVGIEGKYIPKVFDMFFRGTVLSTGSGLGLYITKGVIGKLEGTISLVSEEHVGTSIVLKIPNLLNKLDSFINAKTEES